MNRQINCVSTLIYEPNKPPPPPWPAREQHACLSARATSTNGTKSASTHNKDVCPILAHRLRVIHKEGVHSQVTRARHYIISNKRNRTKSVHNKGTLPCASTLPGTNYIRKCRARIWAKKTNLLKLNLTTKRSEKLS